jgi:hypothetical protein
MVEREELVGVSCGISPTEIAVVDADGVEIDCARDFDRHRDPNLTFVIRRFTLREVSLCACPADPGATIRALGTDIARIGQRMQARQEGLLDLDAGDDGMWRRVVMPARGLIQCTPPEPLFDNDQHRAQIGVDGREFRRLVFYGAPE